MRFETKIPKTNIINLLRAGGYHFQKEEENEMSFYHLLGSLRYPRFHIYLMKKKEVFVFNLHLDQKKPSYKGSPAHSAEYEGNLLEEEKERIKKLLGL